MRVSFSIDLRDSDGDAHSYGIFLHVSDSTILRFANLRELVDFQIDLTAAMKEIKEAYADSGRREGEGQEGGGAGAERGSGA